MKKSQVRHLRNNYSPCLLTAILILISFFAKGQAVYNPAQQPGFTFVVNKPFGQSAGVPLDARSYKADTINFLYRPYNQPAEVLTYLNTPNSRKGQFPIIVNIGGTLQSNGTYIGGVIYEFWFRNGILDSQLVVKAPISSGTCVGCLLAVNNLSDLASAPTARTNLGLGTMATQSTTAGGTNLSGAWPDPLVVRFNGQLPSYYLNYLNLTNHPAIPAQINITDAGLFTHSGVYPNYTFNVVTPGIQAVITANNALSGDNTINTGVFNLILGGTSAFGLPSGTTAQRPSSPSAGWVRWNTDSLKKETFNGSIWVSDGTGGSGPGSGITALTGDGTASGTGSVPFTLATVNSNVFGSNTFLKFGVNGKGLTTSATAVLGSDITGALGFTPYNVTNPAGYITLTALSGTGYILYDNTTGVIKADTSAGKLASQTYVNSRGFITLDSALINQYGLLQTLVGSGKYWRLDSATVFSQIRATIPSGLQTLTYTQNALTNTLAISSGNTQTFLIADHTHAGLLDSGRANSIDSLRLGLKTFTLYAVQGLQMVGATGDSIGLGGTPFFQPDTIKTAGQPFLITGLPNKTVGGTDSALIEDANGKIFKALFPSGGGAVASVSNADGTLTISPTTGAVVASLNLSHANPWTATQTFTLAPVFSSLTGYLKGNGSSALTASATVPTTDLTGTLQAAQEPAHTNDVTNTAGSLALTIAANAVTNAKAAQMGPFTIKANNTAGTANPLDISPAQLLSMTNLQNSLQVVASAYTAKGDVLGGTGPGTYGVPTPGADGSVLVRDNSQTTGIRWSVQPTIFNVFDVANAGGAYGDGQVATDGAMIVSTDTLVSSQMTFVPADTIGAYNGTSKYIYVKGIGAGGFDTLCHVIRYIDAHHICIGTNTATGIVASVGGGGHIFRFGHDDIPAFQACLNAVYNRGGGVVYIPALAKGKFYVFAGPLIHSDNLGKDPNAQWYIPSENFPSNTNPDSSSYSIKILGEVVPVFTRQGALVNDSTAGWTGGCMISSFLTANYGQGAVLGMAAAGPTGFTTASAIRPTLENLDIVVPDGLNGAYRSGIDMFNAVGMEFKNNSVTTDMPCQQKHKSIYRVFGMRFTGINNNEEILLDGFNQNTGFNIGAVVGEHTSGQILSCNCNTTGLLATQTNHPWHISTYKSHWNADPILFDTLGTVPGVTKFQLDQMDIEAITPAGRYYFANHGFNDSLHVALGRCGYFFGVGSLTTTVPTFNPTTTNAVLSFLGDQLNGKYLLAGGASKLGLGTFSGIGAAGNPVFEIYTGTNVSGSSGWPQLLLSNNQSSASSEIGALHFINRAANNNIAQIIVTTDANTTSGKMFIRTWNTGSLVNNLILNGTSATFGTPVTLLTGTTTQAPLNIPGGTLKTSPANGDIENDGTSLYYTSGGTRHTVYPQAGGVSSVGNPLDIQLAGTSGAFASVPILHADTINRKLGIWVQTPLAPLHVNGLGGTKGQLLIQDSANSGSSSTAWIGFAGHNGTRIGYIGNANLLGGVDPNFYYGAEIATGNHIWTTSAGEQMRLTNGGALLLGLTASSGGYLQIHAATTGAPQILLTSSAGTNVTSPTSGMLWWNGTNLDFRTGSSTIDLLNPSSFYTTDGTFSGNRTASGGGFSLSLGASGSKLTTLSVFTTAGINSTGGLYNSTEGSELLMNASTINNAVTAASGNVANFSGYAFLAPTITSTNTSVTYNNPATLRISDAPTMSTNSTATGRLYALDVAAGISHFGLGTSNFSAVFDGSVIINGGAATNTIGLSLGASTTSQTSLAIQPGVNPTAGSIATTSGNIWNIGTSLYVVDGSSAGVKRDILTGINNYNHTIFTPTTGGTVNLTALQYNIINPAGALVALTVNLPSSPRNNDVVYIKYTQSITTVTYGNGTVVDGITSPVGGGLVILTFDTGTSSWY